MSRSQALVSSKSHAPRAATEEELLERLWGVAECGRCGHTVVLGEELAGNLGELCADCRGLAAASPRVPRLMRRRKEARVRSGSKRRARLRDAA